jgi:hypothetical protein
MFIEIKSKGCIPPLPPSQDVTYQEKIMKKGEAKKRKNSKDKS